MSFGFAVPFTTLQRQQIFAGHKIQMPINSLSCDVVRLQNFATEMGALL